VGNRRRNTDDGRENAIAKNPEFFPMTLLSNVKETPQKTMIVSTSTLTKRSTGVLVSQP
jgi:hypothetical protein